VDCARRDDDTVARAHVSVFVADAQMPAAGGEEVQLLADDVVVLAVAPPTGTVASASDWLSVGSDTRPASSRIVEPSSVTNASAASSWETCIGATVMADAARAPREDYPARG
jgi:hypothetical protein